MLWPVVPVLLMPVLNVVDMNDEPPLPLAKELVPLTRPNPLEAECKVGVVGVIGRLVESLTLGTILGSPAEGSDVTVTLTEVVANGPPVLVDGVLETPVPLLLTGPVPVAFGADVKGV